jgi:hypothetical protein
LAAQCKVAKDSFLMLPALPHHQQVLCCAAY